MSNDFLGFFLDEATDILANWEQSCLAFDKSGDHEAVESLYRGAHNLKSGSAAVGMADFSHLIHRFEDLIARVIAGKVASSPQLIRLMYEAHTVFSNWIQTARTDAAHVPQENIDAITHALTQFDGSEEIQEPSIPSTESTEHHTVATSPSVETPHILKQEPNATERKGTTKNTENVRVAAAKLDLLIQLVGELTTQQAIVWHGRQTGQLQSKSCDNALQLIQKNIKDLQNLALSLRMQPLQNLFQRLERTARDLARTQGKKIDVKLLGEHVELDKSVIERITEAMTHVIRNAVDHGIEPPEKRLADGKSETAVLCLEGSQEPGNILIVVRDDGRGLNLERILQKAIEKGLASADQTYSPAEIQSFIFKHGFSTAEKVTDVSGRGVGMDVVKTSVEAINGTIGVSSVPGQGTSFAISLPATLSIVDALIVELDHNRYAVPLQDVAEIVDLCSYAVTPSTTNGRLLSLRRTVVPVEHLRDHLPINKIPTSNIETNVLPALLVRAGGQMFAFQIDRIVGQQDVAMRPLPGGLDNVPGFTGGSILGDGDPCIILNLPVLAQLHLQKSGNVDVPDHKDDQTMGAKQDADRYLVFNCGSQCLAMPLLEVREILTDVTCDQVIGSNAEIMGCIDLRGDILPVLNITNILGLDHTIRNGPIVIVDLPQRTFAIMVEKVEAVTNLEVLQTPHILPTHLNEKAYKPEGMARFRDHIIPVITAATLQANVVLLETLKISNSQPKNLAS